MENMLLKCGKLSFSILTSLLLCMTFFVQKVSSTAMEVTLSNTPGFYYSHRCDLSITIVSTKFLNYNYGNTERFMFTILESSEESRFLNYFVQPYIERFDFSKITQAKVDNCQRGIATSKFYCAQIISSRMTWPEVKIPVNSTHGMYKFSILNLVCPRTNKGIGNEGYHLKFKLQVAVNQFSPDIEMSQIFTYKFKGLKYRLISSIIANKVYNSDGSPFVNNDTEVQARHYLINSNSLLQINVFFPNSTQQNLWENIQLHFLQPPSINFKIQTCNLEISSQNMSTLIYKKYKQQSIECQFSSITNVLQFNNKNYADSSYVFNQAINRYQLFNQPSVRYRFSVQIKFTEQTQVQFGYRVTATTSLQIGDDGKLSNISTTNAVLYDSLDTPEALYGLNQSEYDKLDPKYRVPVLVSPSQSGSFSSSDGFMSEFFGKLTTISNLPLLTVVAILLLVMLLVCIRKELWMLEKYLFLLFVLSDLFVKVAIIVTINALAQTDALYVSNKEVSFMLSVFLAVQYGGFGVVLFFTYWLYIMSTQQHNATALDKQASKVSQRKTKPEKQSSRKNKALVVLAMLFNYKFYCVCLFDLQVGKDLKLRRFRNDQLYVKFCWHLGIEVALILVQIFCVLSSCTYIPVSVVFAVHQGVYALLMAVVGKAVFRILAVKKLKKKVREICNMQTVNTQGKANNADVEQAAKNKQQFLCNIKGQNSQYHRDLEIYSKKSGKCNSKLEAQENQHEGESDRKF